MRARRVIAGGVAAVLAGLLATSSELVLEEEFLGWAWPWLWGVACAAAVVAAARPASLDAWVTAAVALDLVIAGRIAALWFRIPEDINTAGQEAVSVQRAVFGTAVYLLLAWLLGCTWWLASPRRYR